MPPVIFDRSEGLQTSDAATWSLTYPSNIKPGDLLLVFVVTDGSVTASSVPTGFVNSLSSASNGTAVSIHQFKKLANGTETGSFNITFSAAEQGCWRVLRIGAWHGTLGINFTGGLDANGGDVQGSGTATGTDNTAEYGDFDPGNWAAGEETLWLIHAGADHGDTVISTSGGSYSAEGTEQHSGGATGAAQFVDQSTSTAASSGTGTFGLSVSEDWITRSLAIRGGTQAGQNTPQDSGASTTGITTAATSHNINVGSPTAGQLLIVLVRFAGAPGAVTFTGYTQFFADTSDASDDDTRVYYRLADGTEGATDTLTTGSSVKLASIAWRINGAADPTAVAPQASAVTVGTAANINPGSFTTSGPQDYLFITMIGMDSETATATQPAEYFGTLQNANSGTGGAVATNCRIWGVSRGTSQVTTEDPSAWTSSAPNAGVTAVTVAISPPPASTFQPRPSGIDFADPAVI